MDAFDQRIASAAQRFERHAYSLIQRSRSCRRETKSLSSKKIFSSRSALAAPSLPWTRLRPIVCARSPRIEPGAAPSGSVAPMSCRQPSIAPCAFDRHRDERTARDEVDETVEERFAFVFAVMLAGAFAVELHQLHRRDHVTASFDARRDFADQPARDRVGLTENERTFDSHGTSFDSALRAPLDASDGREGLDDNTGGSTNLTAMRRTPEAGPYEAVARELAGTRVCVHRLRRRDGEHERRCGGAARGRAIRRPYASSRSIRAAGPGVKGARGWRRPGSALLCTTILPRSIDTGKLWVVPFWARSRCARALLDFGVATTLQWPNDLLARRPEARGRALPIERQRREGTCGVRRRNQRSAARRRLRESSRRPRSATTSRPVDRAALLRAILREYEAPLAMLDRPDA